MSNHPYPEHVRVAVAETIAKQVLVMREWADLTAQTRKAFLKDADQVLHTLWDASRVDAVSEVEQLPREAMLRTRIGELTFAGTMRQMTASGDYPAHVIYWGDSDA